MTCAAWQERVASSAVRTSIYIRGRGTGMAVHDPNQAHRTWGEAFNRGDIEALVALYAPDAVLVPEPGKQVSGTANVRAALEGFMSLNGTMKLETQSVVVGADIALTRGRW